MSASCPVCGAACEACYFQLSGALLSFICEECGQEFDELDHGRKPAENRGCSGVSGDPAIYKQASMNDDGGRRNGNGQPATASRSHTPNRHWLPRTANAGTWPNPLTLRLKDSTS
jgi:hypothetical protein